MALILTPLEGLPLVRAGDDVAELIIRSIFSMDLKVCDGDVFVITQKIISKSEGRMVSLSGVSPSEKARRIATEVQKDPRLIELILRESQSILRLRPGTIITEHKLGFICANAGIDHSNVLGDENENQDQVLLLPENPDLSASLIREKLSNHFQVNLGVLIIDSHGRAWRLGTVGVVIGVSGIPALVDLRGHDDLFGYKLRVTQIAAADELAAAASLVMGQAAEGTPVVHVRGFPYQLRESSLRELIRPIELDLFR